MESCEFYEFHKPRLVKIEGVDFPFFYGQMTYEEANLICHMPHLIELINKRMAPETVVKHYINTISPGVNYHLCRIYIKMSNMREGYYRFDINKKGEMWNPLLQPAMMACAFDWLMSFDYNQKRQMERVQKFKSELIEKVWAPSESNFLLSI
jgi:hypothetical protein